MENISKHIYTFNFYNILEQSYSTQWTVIVCLYIPVDLRNVYTDGFETIMANIFLGVGNNHMYVYYHKRNKDTYVHVNISNNNISTSEE